MSLDAIQLFDNGLSRDGVAAMLETIIGPNELVQPYVSVETGLLIIEIAKRVDDRVEWFPRGRWATIQMVQHKIDLEFGRVFSALKAREK